MDGKTVSVKTPLRVAVATAFVTGTGADQYPGPHYANIMPGELTFLNGNGFKC